MVIDTSALIAILLSESEKERFIYAILMDNTRLISTPTFTETSIVFAAKLGSDNLFLLDSLIRNLEITLADFTADQAMVARIAYSKYGKGCQHPARLNMGDCFSYALAKVTDEPLIFKGNDFSKTDIKTVF